MESIEVQYLPDEANQTSPLVVKILPAKRNRYREILDLSHILMREFAIADAYPADLLISDNENVWSNIKKMAKLLPLSGGGELDCDRLADEDIIRIFFTRSTNKEDGRLKQVHPDTEEVGFAPSEIARLHGFNFFKILHRGVEMQQEQEKNPQNLQK